MFTISANTFKALVIGAASAQLLVGVALAAPMPNMLGNWVGKSKTIAVDTEHPNSGGSWDKPLLLERRVELKVTHQQGNRYWGQVYGNGKLDGPFIGAISADGKQTYLVGPNATASAFFTSPKQLDYCYFDDDADIGRDTAHKASCSSLIKQ